MRFSEIINRLNGFSCPVFGVSWSPLPLDVDTARRVITFLEDRRALYNDFAWEMPDHCIESAREIRSFLTTELGLLPDGSQLAPPLKSIRAACRKFMDGLQRQHSHRRHLEEALGELRSTVGLNVAILAVQYGIDVEADLASILPAEDEG